MQTISAAAVRQALLSLYVPTELANCDLAARLPEVSAIDDVVQRAQSLRGKLLDAVEQMRPAAPGTALARSGGATSARAYDCLRLRYISGLDVEEVARQLAVGGRQVYRDLHWAEEQMAQLLSSRAPTRSPEGGRDLPGGVVIEEPDVLEQEIRALSSKPEPVLLEEVVRSAIEIVSGLAGRQGVSVLLEPCGQQALVACTPAVLRQVLTLVLSAVLQDGSARSELHVRVEQGPEAATIAIPLADGDEALPTRIRAALQIAEAQYWQHEVFTDGDVRALSLSIPLAKRRRVLVIEDNPGAYALYERYLSTSEWEPTLAAHPRLAVDLAADKQVEAVVLDLMMAETDGWSLLQALKLNPRTGGIPVIICSVVNDPELGLALGASACLSKPVSRLGLLKALRQAVRERR